ncbi:hypothetical protein ONS95_010647 [Cadophora gregata]|uniref:uncharacterized protein n=1 Tax=Cadophora gregata TaxID=51156 RepID=UPI0026DD712A|nr:uncharacterized protein ONS95_010647 [Cadophora gregata]KAK0122408.1 hypothetical protein ONS95_010647 [Cadophora gregata]KAK0127887.1 hypothetical protein ONS96_007387 [Cadophora gregata f. sp. sojae]
MSPNPRPVLSSSEIIRGRPANIATPGTSNQQELQRGTRTGAVQGKSASRRRLRHSAPQRQTASQDTASRHRIANTASLPITTSPAVATVGTVTAPGTPVSPLPPQFLRPAQSNSEMNGQQTRPSQPLRSQTTSLVPATLSDTTLGPVEDTQDTPGMKEASSEHDEKNCVEEVPLHQLIRSGSMVKIYVGAEKHCWVLHEDALCHYSEYFKKAFQGHFAEADQKSIVLEEDDSVTFGSFVEWIYTGRIDCSLHAEKSHTKQPKEHFLLYIHLEISADKYLLPVLSECALLEWENCHSRDTHIKLLVEEIKLIFEKCPEKSKFRLPAVMLVLRYYMSGRNQDYNYMGQVLSCDPSFAETFAKELKNHQDLEATSSCWIDGCSLHPVVVASNQTSAHKRQRVN